MNDDERIARCAEIPETARALLIICRDELGFEYETQPEDLADEDCGHTLLMIYAELKSRRHLH